MKSEPETYSLPPSLEVIELNEGDIEYEAWATDWTEFQEPQYGPNWRFALVSVIRSNGTLEWALIRQYEHSGKDVILHMAGDFEQWETHIIPNAQAVVKAGSPKDTKYGIELVLEKTTWKDLSEV